MEKFTATITFHGSDHYSFEPLEGQHSRYQDLEYSQSAKGCSFNVPVIMQEPKSRSIQETLEYFSIHLSRPAVPLVNGKPQDLNYILQPGDEVVMLFQISGG